MAQKWDVSDYWNLFQILLHVLAKNIEQNRYSEVLFLEPGKDKSLHIHHRQDERDKLMFYARLSLFHQESGFKLLWSNKNEASIFLHKFLEHI